MKKGVLLINLGTPDSPKVRDVRKYLMEFLMDDRVIDIPGVIRFLLVNFIIAPFRAPKSARLYQRLWLDEGSPLIVYGKSVLKKLQNRLGEEFEVELAMRYQNPAIREGLRNLQKKHISELIIVPLFPQYASATTGSIIEKVMKETKSMQRFPAIRFTQPFYNSQGFIDGLAGIGRKYLEEESWDHILFSYHGLPERQILKASTGTCNLGDCCNSITEENFNCYRAQCFATTRLMAEALDIKPEKYTVVFQSRLGKARWIQPYAEDVIQKLPGKGCKKVLVFCPSFISDCLETTLEVGEEFKKVFVSAGGEKWQLVEGLNDSDAFIQTLQELIRTPSYGNPSGS